MSLAERLRKKAVKVETVTVDGDKYVVTGKSKRDRAALMARCRNKKDGSLNGDKLEGLMLEACVADQDGSTATASDWDVTPSHITGPLIKAIMNVNGLDDDDLAIADPKDLDSTES